jgi:hypothetical protein
MFAENTGVGDDVRHSGDRRYMSPPILD